MGVKNFGGKNFGPLKSLGFQQLSYILDWAKDSLDCLEKKYGNID